MWKVFLFFKIVLSGVALTLAELRHLHRAWKKNGMMGQEMHHGKHPANCAWVEEVCFGFCHSLVNLPKPPTNTTFVLLQKVWWEIIWLVATCSHLSPVHSLVWQKKHCLWGVLEQWFGYFVHGYDVAKLTPMFLTWHVLKKMHVFRYERPSVTCTDMMNVSMHLREIADMFPALGKT